MFGEQTESFFGDDHNKAAKSTPIQSGEGWVEVYHKSVNMRSMDSMLSEKVDTNSDIGGGHVFPDDVELSLTESTHSSNTARKKTRRRKNITVKGKRLREKVRNMGAVMLSSNRNMDTGIRRVSQEDDSNYKKLHEDVFSFLFSSKILSAPFLYASLIFLMQMFIMALIMVDLLSGASSDNPLKVPPGVAWQVRISQFFALLIALVFTDNDIISSLDLMGTRMTYEKATMGRLNGASLAKWILAQTCRVLQGFFNLIITFVLIIQSDSVIELFFNFATMQFVSHLDNVAFAVARKGYITCHLQVAANNVKQFRFPRKELLIMTYVRRVLFFLILASMVSMWVVVTNKQKQGEYLCRSITVQLGDESYKGTRLEHYSGLYSAVPGLLINGRAVYAEKENWQVENSDGHSRGILSYCEDKQVWGFLLSGNKFSSGQKYLINGDYFSFDPCDFILSSPKLPDSYDIIKASSVQWYSWIGVMSSVSLFSLLCNECKVEENARDENGISNPVCNYNGYCMKTKQCICTSNWYGITCDLENPFPRVEVSNMNKNGLREKPNTFRHAIKYKLLQEDGTEGFISVYDRPVYVYDRPRERNTNSGGFDFLVFSGRRWVAGYSNLTVSEFSSKNFRRNLRFRWEDVIVPPLLTTVPTHKSSPAKIDWQVWLAYGKNVNDAGIIRNVELTMISPLCNENTNPCVRGKCNTNRRCECIDKSYGALCHLGDYYDQRIDAFSTEELNPIMLPFIQCGPQEFKQKAFQLTVHTDDSPQETYWELTDGNGKLLGSIGPNELDNVDYTYNDKISQCFDENDCYRFKIFDYFGDGISQPGWYEVSWGYSIIRRGGNFSDYEETWFGNCVPPASPTSSLPPMISISPSTAQPTTPPTANLLGLFQNP